MTVILLTAGAAGSQAAATIVIGGAVTCHTKHVTGVWVESGGGGSGFATIEARMPGNTKVAYYRKELTANVTTNIRLHVGCGGDGNHWSSDNWTATNFPITKAGKWTVNATCVETLPPSGSPTRVNPSACEYPPRGATTTAIRGDARQCTRGAHYMWRLNTGRYGNWGGDAHLWATRARDAMLKVVSTPMRRSIVVFPGATSPPGHVAWVDTIRVAPDAVELDITECNRVRGKWSHRTIKHKAGYKYILARPGQMKALPASLKGTYCDQR